MENYKPDRFLLYMYIVLGVTIVTLFMFLRPIDTDDTSHTVKAIAIQGVYQRMSSDVPIPFQQLKDISIGPDDNELILRGHVKQDIPKDKKIMMYITRLQVHIQLNGKDIYHEEGDDYTWWDSFDSPGITPKDELVIHLQRATDSNYPEALALWLRKFSSGETYALLLYQLQRNAAKIIISSMLLIIGLALLFSMGVLRLFKIDIYEQFFSCAMLLISGAVCTFIDYEYITLLFPYPGLINIIDYLSQMLICEFLLIYLSTFLNKKSHIKTANVMIFLWTLCIVGYCLFQKGRGSDAFLSPAWSMLVLEMVFLIREYKMHMEKRIKYVVVSVSVLTGCTIIEIVHYSFVHFYWIYVFQAGLLFFTIVQCIIAGDFVREKMQQASLVQEMQGELAQSRIRVMLSQIQPHFVFNVLNAISGLCLIHPEKADDAIIQFSNYLRANINSLQSQGLVNFEEEMKHIRCYVALEQLRFGNKIHMVYNIDAANFSLPALTLEPLVENAVKHGLRSKSQGGTVMLKTAENMKEICIIIEDDGVGFDWEALQKDSHASIGIMNVRSRLEYMLQAKMTITSVIGRGTKVMIQIPKKGDDRV